MKCNCCICFKILSTKSRFKIFEYLKDKKKKFTVSTLVKLTGLRQPTVTFHLNKLAKKGFIKKSKAGREVFCQVQKKCDSCPLYK